MEPGPTFVSATKNNCSVCSVYSVPFQVLVLPRNFEPLSYCILYYWSSKVTNLYTPRCKLYTIVSQRSNHLQKSVHSPLLVQFPVQNQCLFEWAPAYLPDLWDGNGDSKFKCCFKWAENTTASLRAVETGTFITGRQTEGSRSRDYCVLTKIWLGAATVIWRLLRTYTAANHGCYGKLHYFIDNWATTEICQLKSHCRRELRGYVTT